MGFHCDKVSEGAFRRLAPLAIELAADSDSTISSLFCALINQLANYFCQSPSRSTENTILLDALSNAATSRESHSKSYKAQYRALLSRYFQQALAQDPAPTSSKTCALQLFMQKVYSMARHPGEESRHTAAVIVYSCRRHLWTSQAAAVR